MVLRDSDPSVAPWVGPRGAPGGSGTETTGTDPDGASKEFTGGAEFLRLLVLSPPVDS